MYYGFAIYLGIIIKIVVCMMVFRLKKAGIALLCYINIATFAIIFLRYLFNTNFNLIHIMSENSNMLCIIFATSLEIIFLLNNLIKSMKIKMILLPVVSLSISYTHIVLLGFGIISVVWTTIINGIFIALLFINTVFESDVTPKMIKKGIVNIEVINKIEDDWKWMFKIIFEGFLALSASVGISMTILYNSKSGFNDYALVSAGAVIVFGFACVSLAIVIFFLIPFINYIISIKKYRFEMANKTSSKIILLKDLVE